MSICRWRRSTGSILSEYISKNHIGDFADYLSQGISPDIDLYHGTRPIHEVCKYGHEDFLNYLIDQGADLNIPDRHHRTAIMICIQCKQWGCFKILVSRGALYGIEIKKWLETRENCDETRQIISELISKLLWGRRNGLVYYYSLGKMNLPLVIFRHMLSFL